MPLLALVPVQQLRQLAAGAEQILTSTLVATPILRAVVGANTQSATAAADANRPTVTTAAKTTNNDRGLRVVAGPSSDVVDAADVRAWARSRGLHVADRGRISRTVIDQYLTAHAS